MKGLKLALYSMVALLIPTISFAHEGHGVVDGNSILHYLSSSLHLAPVLLVTVVGVFFILRKRRASVK